MARGRTYHDYDRQVINMVLVEEEDYTDMISICIPRFAWMVARAFLSTNGHKATSYAMATQAEYYESPDEDEIDVIKASIDEALATTETECTSGESDMPIIGEIRTFAFWDIPTGWLNCNGSAMDTGDYAALYNVIGFTFGQHIDRFRLPNLTDQFQRGINDETDLAGTGGSETVTLQTTQMPSHSHDLSLASLVSQGTGPHNPRTTNGTMRAGFVGSTGGGQPHENLPPYLNLVFAIYAGTE